MLNKKTKLAISIIGLLPILIGAPLAEDRLKIKQFKRNDHQGTFVDRNQKLHFIEKEVMHGKKQTTLYTNCCKKRFEKEETIMLESLYDLLDDEKPFKKICF